MEGAKLVPRPLTLTDLHERLKTVLDQLAAPAASVCARARCL